MQEIEQTEESNYFSFQKNGKKRKKKLNIEAFETTGNKGEITKERDHIYSGLPIHDFTIEGLKSSKPTCA